MADGSHHVVEEQGDEPSDAGGVSTHRPSLPSLSSSILTERYWPPSDREVVALGH